MELVNSGSKEGSHAIPMLIKMPDLSQGFGSAVNLSLLKLIKPSHIYFMARGTPRLLENVAEAVPSAKFCVLPPLEPPIQLRSDDELYDMRMIAEFHRGRTTSGDASWDTTPITERPPFCASFAKTRRDFFAVLCLPTPQPKGRLADILNASLVSIVFVKDRTYVSSLDVDDEPESGIPFVTRIGEQAAALLDPRKSSLLGVALVRGVNTRQQHLQLVLDPDILSNLKALKGSIILVHGCHDTPRALLLEEQYHREWMQTNQQADGLIDDSPDTYNTAVERDWTSSSLQSRTAPGPYLEVDDGSGGSKKEGEARWKSRKFNMGGAG